MEVFTEYKAVKNYGDFFLHSIEPSSSPPPPHPQPPNLFIFALVGFLRVDGRGFCWQISLDPHYIWLFTQVTVYTSKSNLKVINSWH
jgi:hypothetical protein